MAPQTRTRDIASCRSSSGSDREDPGVQGRQRFRAGCEGLISVLFRGRGMKRCLAQGRERFELWVAAAVLVNNLMKIAALLMPNRRAGERPPDNTAQVFCSWKKRSPYFIATIAWSNGRFVKSRRKSRQNPTAAVSLPGFLGELTRVSTNAGVLRQKLLAFQANGTQAHVRDRDTKGFLLPISRNATGFKGFSVPIESERRESPFRAWVSIFH